MRIPTGINQRELDRIWRQHGGIVESVFATGERRYVYPPTGETSTKYNARRKSAVIELVLFVRRILRRIDASSK